MGKILCWLKWHRWQPETYINTFYQSCTRCGLWRKYLGWGRWKEVKRVAIELRIRFPVEIQYNSEFEAIVKRLEGGSL